MCTLHVWRAHSIFNFSNILDLCKFIYISFLENFELIFFSPPALKQRRVGGHWTLWWFSVCLFLWLSSGEERDQPKTLYLLTILTLYKDLLYIVYLHVICYTFYIEENLLTTFLEDSLSLNSILTLNLKTTKFCIGNKEAKRKRIQYSIDSLFTIYFYFLSHNKYPHFTYINNWTEYFYSLDSGFISS